MKFIGRKAFLLVLAVFVLCPRARAQDTARYLNKAWRDSVASYTGRLETYHQELYSYDWGMTFGMLPVAGESYVGKLWTGVVFSGARASALGASVVGLVRLIARSPGTGLNIGLVAGGVLGYVALKLWELADIRRTVSHENEALVGEYGIRTPDIVPHSIRYPTRKWPKWITSWPPARHPANSRSAVNAPMPSVTSAH